MPMLDIQASPEISVVLAVHNGMPYLPETMGSLFRQAFKRFECVVVDDASSDDTWRYLQSLDDPRIRAVRLQRVGFATALNEGIRLASSKWVARIDADDVAEPERLGAQFAVAKTNFRVALIGCQARCIDQQSAVVGERQFPVSDSAIRFQMFFGCPFLHPGVMFPRELAMACGGYRASYAPSEDYDLWTRLAGLGELANHPAPLMQYRLHGSSMTTTRLREMTEMCARIAGEYAARGGCGVSEDRAKSLYAFLETGDCESSAAAHDLLGAYQRVKRHSSAADAPAGSELATLRDSIQRRFRWLCLEKMALSRRRPGRALAWLRLASAFDEEHGAVSKICARGLAKMMRRCARPVLSALRFGSVAPAPVAR